MKHFYTNSLMNRPNTERCTLGNENQQNRYGKTHAFSSNRFSLRNPVTPTQPVTAGTHINVLNILASRLCALAVMVLLLISFASTAYGQSTLTVYNGTNTNNYIPIYGYYFDEYTKSEFIIPATQLTTMTGGIITAMTFYVSNISSGSGWGDHQLVFMKEVSGTTIGGSYQGTTDATIVFNGQLARPTGEGEYTINFQTNYTYNGGNLLIGVYNDDDNGWTNVYWYGVSNQVSGVAAYGSNSSSLGNVSYTAQAFLPKTTFTYTPLPTPTITQTLNPLPGCGMDNATLTASLGGSSMPTGYAYYWYSDAACTSEITSGVSGTNNNTLSYPASNGTHIWCRLEKRTVTITSTPSSTFNFTGGIQQYTVLPNTISLTLETWGAQGGSYNNTWVGGSGGYAKGILESPAIGSTLYVVVGGQPDRVTSTSGGTSVPGGYNGGGNAVVHSYSSGYSVPQGGGGATHIATVSGLLSSLSAQQDNVLVVAGGGSGSVFYHKYEDGTDGGGTGYAGGGGTSSGYTGGSYTYTANQTTAGNGGSFGQGASYTGNTNYRYGPAGGGGGWYGGGNRQYAQDNYNAEYVLGHGGGSGHVNSSLTGATMTTGGRTGHGMAKITASIGTTTVESVGDAGEISIQCAEVQCEGFEGGTMPTGWTSVSGIGTTSWSVGTGDYNTSTGAHTGTYNAKIQSSTRSNETYLVSPSQDFSGASLVTLSFWYINREWSSDIDELTVYYRTNTSDTWHQLFYTAGAHATWTQEQGINLPNLSSTYQIAFKWTSHYGYGVGIDDVCFVITPGDCTPPSISFASTSNTGTLGSAYSHPSLTCNSNGTRHWSSSNTNVATVDETSGVVTLKDCGQTTITLSVDATATYCSGTASYTLNVSGNTQSISNCPPGNLTSGSTWTPALNSGQSFTNWSSSNNSRATVNTTTGVVTLKQPGEVTISGTVPAYGSYCGGTVNCTFTVTCATNTSTFAFSPANGSVAEEATINISGNLTLPTGATVTSYASDNTSVATVTNAGVVTSVSAGTAHITATVSQWTNDGVTYCERTTTNSFTVTVTGDGCAKIVNPTPTASSSGTYGGIYTWTNAVAYTQQLYTKAELNAAGISCTGELTSIALNYQETTSSALTFDVYIGQTSQSTVPTSWITDANLALGYSGTTTFNTGWNSIDVSNAHFTWDGTSNIVVAIMRTTSTQGAVQWPNFYHTNTSNMMVYLANATLNGNHVATANGTSGVQRPEMKFCISCCTPRTGTFEYTTTSHTITAGSTYTNTTLNNQTGTSVTRYEIYPTGQGATINASSGQVTTTVGTDRTFTVTAIIEGGSTYCDLSTSYTLTVNDGCYQVGTDMSAPTSNSLLPIYTGSTSSYSYSQQVYTASDILAVDGCRGQINSIKFQYYGTSNLTIPIELYLGSTSSSSLSSGWITDAGLTKVYTSPAGGTTFSSVWVELTLDTPYDWNGTDNIVVAVKTTGTPSGTYRYFYYTSAAGTTRTCNATSEIGLSSSNVPEVAGTSYGYRPNIRFCINCCTERDGQLNITSDPACPASIPYGSTLQLTGSVASGYGDGTASWSSSNTSVATVGESSGLISAGDIGTTVITYTRAYDGTYCKASTTCTVNVTVPTPQITQETPLPQCDIENATLVAGVPAGSAVPPGYTYHWYSNSTFTAEITSGVSGSNNNRLSYPATSGGQVWCRLEKPGSTPSQTFNYTGNVQEYTVPENATSLTLEVWGAQGGSYSSTYSGGKGGYSKGTLASPTAGSKLYVVVGQQPEAYTTTPTTGGATISGGYNGGGNAVVHYYSYSGNTGWSLPQGGGGATHIATVTGQLNTLSAQQDNVLIVAGGGSGGVYCYGTGNVGLSGYTGFSGYAGGGTTSNGYAGGTYTYTANQTAAGNGGSFGHGASYTGNTNYRYGPSGGGGGWYGGGNRQTAQDTFTEELVHGHGGGSGYIKSTLTTTSSSNGQRSGNGEAKITAVIPDSYGPAKEFTIKCCGLDAEIQFAD